MVNGIKQRVFLGAVLLVWSAASWTEAEALASTSSGPHAGQTVHDGGWFPDWDVPDFGFDWGPILGGRYQEWTVSEPASDADGAQSTSTTWRTLSIEGGVHLRAHHVPVFRSDKSSGPASELNQSRSSADESVAAQPVAHPVTVTLSPSAGYAYGRSVVTSDSGSSARDADFSADFEGQYHRMLLGLQATSFYRMVRYSLGLNYGRVFGEARFGVPLTQAEVVQDVGLRTTRRLSLHVSPTFGRIYRNEFQSFVTQYTDVWLHARLTPFASLVVDTGPGVSFDWLPELDAGSRSVYWRGVMGWQIFGPLAVSVDARYEVDAESDTPPGLHSSQDTSLSQQAREPLRELQSASAHVFRQTDDFQALFFVGLRGILFGWSVGYLSLYQASHALERESKRQSKSSQGFGIFGQVTL